MAHTRKHKQQQKQTHSMMTIPQLRKAFDHIEDFTMDLLRRTSDKKERRKAFQTEWAKVFHRNVDDASADAYLAFEAKKSKGSKSHTHKHARKQKGGAPLAGAPLDYSTRPGIYGVYGTFPEYITGGFATMGDATNKMAIQEGCNSAAEAAKFQAPYTGFGAVSLAQKGGKQSRKQKGRKGTRKHKHKQRGGAPTFGEFASALTFRPLTSSAPPSQLYTNMMEWKGGAPYPSPLANTGNPGYQALKAQIYAPTAGDITRDLTREI
jgi:hypothetical protein